MVDLASFWKLEACGQTVLPDILSTFQTTWICWLVKWQDKMCFDFFRARIHFSSQLHLSANAQLTSHFSTLEKYRSFDRLEDLEAWVLFTRDDNRVISHFLELLASSSWLNAFWKWRLILKSQVTSTKKWRIALTAWFRPGFFSCSR